MKVIFLGGVGNISEFGGELTKNKEIIRRLEEYGCDIVVLDSYNCSRNYMKLFFLVVRFFWNVLIHPKACFLFSTSFSNIYSFIKILHYYPITLNIVYWVIGGSLVERIQAGEFSLKYLKCISTFIVEGKIMKVGMEELGLKNVIQLPNFKTIDTFTFSPKANDSMRFVFLSRIMPEKGCQYIIDAVRLLNKKYQSEEFEVDFYGVVDSLYKDEFLNACREISNIRYCGSLNLRDKRNYEVLSSYHYMLFPTYWYGEGFPGVVIDAYMSGLPIIASDWNINEEFIHDGETGYIIPAHSVNALFEIMDRVITDKSNYDKVVANCISEAKKYDTINVIDSVFIETVLCVK